VCVCTPVQCQLAHDPGWKVSGTSHFFSKEHVRVKRKNKLSSGFSGVDLKVQIS